MGCFYLVAVFDSWSDVFKEFDGALSEDFPTIEDFHWIRRSVQERRNSLSSLTKIFLVTTKKWRKKRKDELVYYYRNTFQTLQLSGFVLSCRLQRNLLLFIEILIFWSSVIRHWWWWISVSLSYPLMNKSVSRTTFTFSTSWLSSSSTSTLVLYNAKTTVQDTLRPRWLNTRTKNSLMMNIRYSGNANERRIDLSTIQTLNSSHDDLHSTASIYGRLIETETARKRCWR